MDSQSICNISQQNEDYIKTKSRLMTEKKKHKKTKGVLDSTIEISNKLLGEVKTQDAIIKELKNKNL